MNVPDALRVIKRDGSVVNFDETKISVAITKAFIAVEGEAYAQSNNVRQQINSLAELVCEPLIRRHHNGGTVGIEDIQDQVELALMRKGLQQIARAYVIYRDQRAQKRREVELEQFELNDSRLQYIRSDGTKLPLEKSVWDDVLNDICDDLDQVDPDRLFDAMLNNAHEDITEEEIYELLAMGARELIEEEPQYSFAAARVLHRRLRNEGLKFLNVVDESQHHGITHSQMYDVYPKLLGIFVARGIELGMLSPELAQMDLEKLGKALVPDRDLQFTYLGLQTLYDRYFLHHQETRFELPQIFFMRVAAGLALGEPHREERAIEFYNVLSSFDFLSSTPTLFNSATMRSQLSSCYVSTVTDDLEGIFQNIHDNAMLSKWAGGLGNDWTPVRAMGSYIRGTNGKSQGVVPFLKVVNDTAVAVNQGGKRKGAVCAYLETWHLDIEEFLELRKNTGDDRRRTPDMHTANWVPDLFMERVINNDTWTLFSPADVPELHECHGAEFKKKYEEAEVRARSGEISQFKVVSAYKLWQSMLSMLYETGHPWITFKDACNIRSPQQHIGVIHSSNLCTEITLNTSENEIAVCNLGSVNLKNHVDESGDLDLDKLRRTVRTAIRMLDNVIDINYYAVRTARDSNVRHRPIGLGIMGFQDLLYIKRIPYSSLSAVQLADESMEAISYFAIEASSDLARERGSYSTYEGSLWSQGILPLDSLRLLQEQRSAAEYADFQYSSTMDWDALRSKVQTQGMRNSNVMAIAPTATIANIAGVTPSIEPPSYNLFVKSNLSGEFTVINSYLIEDLKRLSLWDRVMAVDLKAHEGSVQEMDRVPEDLKELYRTAFELDPAWLVDAAARRQKWIDQSQSLNLFFDKPLGRQIDAIYRRAWTQGLKTTYYLRSVAATNTEKSTLETDNSLNVVRAHAQPTRVIEKAPLEAMRNFELGEPAELPDACAIDDPDCEACQ